MMPSGIYYRALLGVSLLVFAPADLLSQSRNTAVTSGQSPLQTQLNMIKLSSRLRLQTASHTEEGRLVFLTADSLGVRRADGQETRLVHVAVDSMWVRRHRTGLGFLIGTLVGGAAYVVLTSAISDDSEVPELDNVFGGLAWAGSTLLGTVAGALSSHWKRVHPN